MSQRRIVCLFSKGKLSKPFSSRSIFTLFSSFVQPKFNLQQEEQRRKDERSRLWLQNYERLKRRIVPLQVIVDRPGDLVVIADPNSKTNNSRVCLVYRFFPGLPVTVYVRLIETNNVKYIITCAPDRNAEHGFRIYDCDESIDFLSLYDNLREAGVTKELMKLIEMDVVHQQKDINSGWFSVREPEIYQDWIDIANARLHRFRSKAADDLDL